MRRLPLYLLTALMVACGRQTAAPPIGDLLGAPTALNVGGQVVTLDSRAASGSQGFGVHVQLSAGRAPLTGVRLDGVFVVGGSGFWKSPLTVSGTQGGAWGAAALRSGEPVQVVVRLRDAQGRALWLRDSAITVGSAP